MASYVRSAGSALTAPFRRAPVDPATVKSTDMARTTVSEAAQAWLVREKLRLDMSIPDNALTSFAADPVTFFRSPDTLPAVLQLVADDNHLRQTKYNGDAGARMTGDVTPERVAKIRELALATAKDSTRAADIIREQLLVEGSGASSKLTPLGTALSALVHRTFNVGSNSTAASTLHDLFVTQILASNLQKRVLKVMGSNVEVKSVRDVLDGVEDFSQLDSSVDHEFERANISFEWLRPYTAWYLSEVQSLGDWTLEERQAGARDATLLHTPKGLSAPGSIYVFQYRAPAAVKKNGVDTFGIYFVPGFYTKPTSFRDIRMAAQRLPGFKQLLVGTFEFSTKTNKVDESSIQFGWIDEETKRVIEQQARDSAPERSNFLEHDDGFGTRGSLRSSDFLEDGSRLASATRNPRKVKVSSALGSFGDSVAPRPVVATSTESDSKASHLTMLKTFLEQSVLEMFVSDKHMRRGERYLAVAACVQLTTPLTILRLGEKRDENDNSPIDFLVRPKENAKMEDIMQLRLNASGHLMAVSTDA